MKRLFKKLVWNRTGPPEMGEAVLELGDNIRIGNITYRIMEDPYDGILQCLPHDPELCQEGYREFHEDEVDDIMWADYEEY